MSGCAQHPFLVFFVDGAHSPADRLDAPAHRRVALPRRTPEETQWNWPHSEFWSSSA
jgi:hypothetical protein